MVFIRRLAEIDANCGNWCGSSHFSGWISVVLYENNEKRCTTSRARFPSHTSRVISGGMLLCHYWEALTDAGKAEGEGGGSWRVLSTFGYTMQLWREAVIVVTTEEMLGDEKFCEGIKSCGEFYKSRYEVHMVKGAVCS